MLIYDNEYQTKEIQIEPKTKLNYNIYIKLMFYKELDPSKLWFTDKSLL